MNDWDETVSALGAIDTDIGPSQAYLVVVRGSNVGETFPVTGPTMVIGRGAGVDLRINDEGVSRFHCKLHQVGHGITVEDLGSRNGTYCNGERVLPGMRALVEGDRIQIGTTYVLRFTYVESSGQMMSPDDEPIQDRLTGAFSRRYFMDRLEKDMGSKAGQRLSLVLVHIDRFPELLTTHGQDVADQLTIAVANHIRDSIRKDDVLARIDGGDYALLSTASPGDTFMLAERLRKSAATLNLGTQNQQITLSLGIASINELKLETAHDVMVAAGSALHRARATGGNRVVLCTPELMREPKNRAQV